MKVKVFILALTIVSLMSACTKSKEEKLEGKWTKIDVTNYGSPKPTTIWEFKSGELIISQIPINGGTSIEKSRAKYDMGFNGEFYTLNITQKVSGEDLYWIMAEGKIKQLNKNYFKWFNKNGFYGEFVRAE